MKKLMAANWKMYKTAGEARTTAASLAALTADTLPGDREVVLFPQFTALSPVADALRHAAGYSVGAQDVYPAAEGAFTGEISPGMLMDCGCAWVLTGHSERRHIIGESDELVGAKTAFSLNAGLKVVLCIGETIEEREAGRLGEVLERQLETGLAGVKGDAVPAAIAVAYEPVWAIGTGKVAGPPEIVEAHALVRQLLVARFGEGGVAVRILYGGSVKPENAREIIALDNVDGVLVGGASLQADSFSRIILA